MEEESFENEEVAQILNRDFISIKVDREEMPHVDKYYQEVHNLVNKRSGGWPLTIILTPKRKAFFAATYIPVDEKYGRMGIKELLKNIEKDFQNNPKKIYDISENIQRILSEHNSLNSKKKDLEISLVNRFVKEVDDSFDHINYGIGTRPKFPHNSTIETLLDIYSVSKNKRALQLALDSLKAMANGGIYDQIEGGFYRYSVDEKWMIPHFEKMLYTNAELLSSYSKAYLITKDEFYKDIVDGIIEFTKIRFEKDNLLYSASDADSLIDGEKEEGAYFVFSYDDVISFLKSKNYDEKEIEKIINYFNITFEGNFENGLTNPFLTNNPIPNNLEIVKKDLKELRSKKEYPFVDYKILTSWNSLYISSLFEAGKIDIQNSLDAIILLDNLLDKLYINDTLYHQRLIYKEPKVKALFEDYAFLIESLLKAYDFSLDKKYLDFAVKLTNKTINEFYENGIWFMSSDEFKSDAGVYDSSYRSSLSQMVDNLLKVAVLNEELNIQEIVKKTIDNNSLLLDTRPSNVAWLLRAYMAYEKGYIVLKAPKNMLENEVLIDYPFLLRKDNIDKKYLACKVDVCFAYDEKFEEILKKIEKEIKD